MTTTVPEMVLGIDFGLARLDVALRTADQEWRWPHRAYTNDWPSWQQLQQALLVELEAHAPVRLTIAGEATGPYWWHAFYHFSHAPELQPFSPQLALLNPAHVKRYRRALPEQDKADPDDARLIAQYYQTVGVPHPYQFQERYLPLRTYSRAYVRITHSLAAEKAYLLSVLYLWASAYQQRAAKPFADLFGVTSQYILTEYADIQAIADLPEEELTTLLQERSGYTFRQPQETARKLQTAVAHSYPLPEYLRTPVHTVLQYTLAHIRELTNHQRAYRQRLEHTLATLPEATPALAFKGLGPVLVAGCLSEIGDTTRFVTGTKFDRRRNRERPRTYRDGQAAVAKLAGLWWPKRDSGQVQGRQPYLARERNPYLRYWFVQAAHTLRHHQTEYQRFYWKKFREAHSHPHKRAIILTARKAVRLIFALLHKGCRTDLKEAPDS